MDRQLKARLGWVNLFFETKNAGYVCTHCGVSRPTLRKWVTRYQELGLDGLLDQSKRPKSCSNRKVNDELCTLLLSFRNERNLGARRIQSELKRLHHISLSLATIHKVLISNSAKPIRKLKRKKKFIRYSRPVPGDRVQIDTCKIGPGIYQYTAVDDCSRFRVLEIYKRRTAANTLKFLDKMIEEFPFPIQRIQSDRGLEFFAEKVQRKMMKYCIKFRPVKPASPHLNGKVERSQKTDLEEFYPTMDLSNFENLKEELGYWQFFYNWQRPHGALKGKTPSQVDCELCDKTPLQEEVESFYDVSKEHIQNANYFFEMQLRKLKGSL
jgi:transposase InsO family protein